MRPSSGHDCGDGSSRVSEPGQLSEFRSPPARIPQSHTSNDALQTPPQSPEIARHPPTHLERQTLTPPMPCQKIPSEV